MAKSKLTRTIIESGKDSVFVYGPTGSGKSRAAIDAFEEMKDKNRLAHWFKITMSPGVEDVDLITKFAPNERGRLEKRKGQLRRVFEAAKLAPVGLLIDEINRATPRATNLVLTAFDPVEGEYVLNDFIEGDQVRVPLENLKVVATANLGGGYTGTSKLDEALLDRFMRTIYWGYDGNLEREIVGPRFEWILVLAEELRNAYRNGSLSSPLSTRHIAHWVEVLKGVKRLTKEAIMETAIASWVYRLVGVDAFGFPNQDEVETIMLALGKIAEEVAG